MSDGRRCRHCLTWKPAKAFGREPRARSGLKAQCNACRSAGYFRNPEPTKARAAQWHREHRPRKHPAETSRLGRHCLGCGLWKEAARFVSEPRVRCGLKSQCKSCRAAEYRRNPEPAKARTKRWVREHRAQHRATNKLWRQRNKERHRAWRRGRYRANPQAYTAWSRRNPEKVKAFKCNWKLANRPRSALHTRIRKARLRANGTGFTIAEWKALCAAHGHRCLACGASERLTADHVIPVSRGGSGSIENIQPLCARCNAKKGIRSTDYRLAEVANG